jgi:hypothetical protein
MSTPSRRTGDLSPENKSQNVLGIHDSTPTVFEPVIPATQESESTSAETSAITAFGGGRAFKRRRASLLDTESSALQAAPYLAKHIPDTYNPARFTLPAPEQALTQPMTTYCNRHNPDARCWRQADEPTMEELQMVCTSLETLQL